MAKTIKIKNQIHIWIKISIFQKMVRTLEIKKSNLRKKLLKSPIKIIKPPKKKSNLRKEWPEPSKNSYFLRKNNQTSEKEIKPPEKMARTSKNSYFLRNK